MAERKQQNRDLTEMEVIDSGSESAASRQCIGCGEMKSKKEMIRVLKTADDTIEIDATGRRNGRGAYLCPSMDCWKKAVKSKGLERSLKMAIPKEVYEALERDGAVWRIVKRC